jgi:hypothetical protein
MSATADPIAAALGHIDDVAREGDLAAGAPEEIGLALDVAEPIRLPDGKVIYPPHVHGEPSTSSPASCLTCRSRASRVSCA